MNTEARKAAIITGASRGIGWGLVEAYRKIGYAVVATSRNITSIDDEGVTAVQGDITDPAAAERVVRTAMERYGRVDTLVNSAGVFIPKPFTDYTTEDYAAVTGVNLSGFFHMTQNVIPHMLAQGSGHIVNMTASLVDNADSRVTSALASLTKGGLQSVTKGLAIEYATRGLRFNAVSPGLIKTPMHKVETHQFLSELHPVKRMGEISDIVDAVLFLENSPFVTGEILHIDGGMSAGH
ncbi:SDR family NAD(P)-dependent oxidoreductase [Streptomyces nigra]|uniref:SDR family NAD(P)-dependent oxidoreductase n=1 Tax=Streptomyces nigra TaxID=1827580 RepID=UPI0036C6BB8D